MILVVPFFWLPLQRTPPHSANQLRIQTNPFSFASLRAEDWILALESGFWDAERNVWRPEGMKQLLEYKYSRVTIAPLQQNTFFGNFALMGALPPGFSQPYYYAGQMMAMGQHSSMVSDTSRQQQQQPAHFLQQQMQMAQGWPMNPSDSMLQGRHLTGTTTGSDGSNVPANTAYWNQSIDVTASRGAETHATRQQQPSALREINATQAAAFYGRQTSNSGNTGSSTQPNTIPQPPQNFSAEADMSSQKK